MSFAPTTTSSPFRRVPTKAAMSFVVLAFLLLATADVSRVSASRHLLQGFAANCNLDADVFSQASACPHDGQWYQFCLLGPAKGGCRLVSAGIYNRNDCNTECTYNVNSPP